MFDITPEEITALNDIDLRELVGRLCEAELVSRGISPAAVTWGGNQTAADGGLDVRVALPKGTSIGGFIPRAATGFQVKKPDMPRKAIFTEMRPQGTIRPVIEDLAHEAGAYIIVSATGSTADSVLRNRQKSLRDALDQVTNACELHTDFYDRTRLATWVRCYPGLITWVKERTGQAHVGWRSYGSWSGNAEDVNAEYLLDDRLTLQLYRTEDTTARSVADAIDELRDELSHPGKVVRLVGLSGVGKTRLAQALFDNRVGMRPLPSSHAIYTNLSDNPDPQPTSLASNLLQNRARAVLIIDNCPPDLHRRLAELCSGNNSKLSILTIEYDIRDDQPEGTQVVRLGTSSAELIQHLLQRRFAYLSQVDARTIAEASGGNSRIAIALAETVKRSGSIAGLSNDELFRRLFMQRQDPDDALLLAAQACSLVYSFDGETLDGESPELPRLALLANQTATQIYRHMGELLRRDLVQKRGVWRAILPHAIANRLAARALEDIPYQLIEEQLLTKGTERLARSFSRRLSFLHEHDAAVAIVSRWLAPEGFLGDVTRLNELGLAMFENVAPVMPEAALAAFERGEEKRSDSAMTDWPRRVYLLRSLAYDALLFERSAKILVSIANKTANDRSAKTASDFFTSFFTIYLSGTHASIEQRIGLIERLLLSNEKNLQTLGLAALSNMLKTTNFRSMDKFEFGARSRNYGYYPDSIAKSKQWYTAALSLMERLVGQRILRQELRDLLAKCMSGLWRCSYMRDEVERLARQFSGDAFWREGWIACRKIIRFSQATKAPEEASRLLDLEAALQPKNLSEQVKAIVLGDSFDRFNLNELNEVDNNLTQAERTDALARELGARVIKDEILFAELLPDLFHGGYQTIAFGGGLANASSNLPNTWKRLVDGLASISTEQCDTRVIMGFLIEVDKNHADLAQDFLDTIVDRNELLRFLPALYAAVNFDERSVKRLKKSLTVGNIPISNYRQLQYGITWRLADPSIIKNILEIIADQPNGTNIALEMLHMRLNADNLAQKTQAPELLEFGRYLLQNIDFNKHNEANDYRISDLIRTCLKGPTSAKIARQIATHLGRAIADYETHAFQNQDSIAALLEVHPLPTLDAFFEGKKTDVHTWNTVLEDRSEHQANPMDLVPCKLLLTWCAKDSLIRYPIAASIITFSAIESKENGLPVWSEQAKGLFAQAPEPEKVLKAFIKRFRPMSWSGSRAAIIEKNAHLLDSVAPLIPSSLESFINDIKAELKQEIADEYRRENERDRTRDEKFE